MYLFRAFLVIICFYIDYDIIICIYTVHHTFFWDFEIYVLLQIIFKIYFNQMNLALVLPLHHLQKGHHILFSAVTFAFHRRNSFPQKMPASTSRGFFFERNRSKMSLLS